MLSDCILMNIFVIDPSSVVHYADRYNTTAIIVTVCFFTFPSARLPFKRLNPEPKENQLPKRPCAHACPEPGVSDRENESSALPVHNGPPLVNGRGPLDGFLSRRRPVPSDENMVIDLTEDNTSSPVKGLGSPTPASPCLPTKDKHQGKDKTASFGKSSNVDHTPKTDTSDCTVDSEDQDEEEDVEEEDGNQTASISQLDTTQDSESEPEEQDESENVSSLGNRSMLSASSVSSTSESSPERPKTDDPTPTSTPTVCTSPIACFLLNPS